MSRSAFTLAALAAAGLVACSGGSGGGDPEIDVAQLYLQRCAACHGAAGEGGIGPSFDGVADRLTREEHLLVIERGRVGSIGQMPAFPDLSAAEREALVEFERGLGGG